MRRECVHFEICPAGFLPVVAVSAAGDCCWKNGFRQSFDTVIAHVSGEIIGALSFSKEKSGVLTVHVIWVAEKWRKRGIGRQMLSLLAPTRLRTEVISEDGLAFFEATRSYCKVQIFDGRQLNLFSFWPIGR